MKRNDDQMVLKEDRLLPDAGGYIQPLKTHIIKPPFP